LNENEVQDEPGEDKESYKGRGGEEYDSDELYALDKLEPYTKRVGAFRVEWNVMTLSHVGL
jgi:hypothetical protein